MPKGPEVDLRIMFGTQVRIKCAFCKKYLAHDVCAGCGAEYTQLSDSVWRVEREPVS